MTLYVSLDDVKAALSDVEAAVRRHDPPAADILAVRHGIALTYLLANVAPPMLTYDECMAKITEIQARLPK